MHKPLSIMVVDTETPGLPPNNICYDIGIVFTDKKGRIKDTYTALVEETFTNPSAMMGAFYAGKMFSHYAPMLADGSIPIKPWATIASEVRELVLKHDVNTIAAYNLDFDQNVLKRTGQVYNATLLPPAKYKKLCLWWFACSTLFKQKAYSRIARRFDWVSDAGNIRTNAEKAFAYSSHTYDFEEDHTALSDALVETDVMAKCFRQKKRIPYGIVGGKPWKLAQA